MSQRVASIDGLRALAVGIVLIFHAFPDWLPGGYIGVDVFFVISGFLITGLIVQAHNAGKFSFVDFYARRARRLLPALLLVCFASLVAGYFVLLPWEYAWLGKEVIAGLFFVPNLFYWSVAGYFDLIAYQRPLLHLWSLGIEEQFYLLWPILLVAGYRFRWSPLLVIGSLSLLSFAYGVYATREASAAAFYSPLSRFWELGIGAALSFAPRCRVRWLAEVVASAAVAAIIAAAFWLKQTSAFPGYLALIPTVSAAGLLCAGDLAWVNRSLFAFRPVSYVGLISYPLYLWHWPIIALGTTAGWVGGGARAAMLGLSLALAAATYEVIERRAHRLPSRAAAVRFAAIAALVALPALGIVAIRGVYSRFTSAEQKVLAYQDYDFGADARIWKCWLTDGQGPQTLAPECTSGKPHTVLWGDSQAARLYPGIRPEAKGTMWQMTRSGCPPLPLPERSASCAAANRTAQAAIVNAKPEVVVLFAAWADYYSDWTEGAPAARALRDTVAALISAGVGRVVVVGPPPRWSPNLPVVVYEAMKGGAAAPDRSRRIVQSVFGVEPGMRAAVTAAGGTYISLQDALCSPEGCLTQVPGSSDLVAYDYAHFTTEGARYAAQASGLMGLLK